MIGGHMAKFQTPSHRKSDSCQCQEWRIALPPHYKCFAREASVSGRKIEASPKMIKSISPQEAAEMIPNGSSLLIGGFMGVGSPHRIIDALVEAGRRDLTVIANDTARPDYGIGRLIRAGAISHGIFSHIGLNLE